MTFFISRVIPTNAAAMYIGPKARQEDIDRVTKQLGLDKPLPVQYMIYMHKAPISNLWYSMSFLTDLAIVSVRGEKLGSGLNGKAVER